MEQNTAQLVEQVASDLDTLPAEDLALVAAFIAYLKQRSPAAAPPLSVAAIRAEAQRRAAALGDVPRTELVRQFQALAEDVRQQAIAQGTAIAGDWERD
jgi:hypothetical protein